MLQVVVDTEEEFDWHAPFSRHSIGVESIQGQSKLHNIYRNYNVQPTYVVDYPVASQVAGYAPLRELLENNECLIGAHLHPWVNPPHVEEISDFNSYPGNLPPSLERRKLEVLTETISRNFGHRPVIYKAGRYGLGPKTFQTLTEMGYQIDLSPVPYNDMSSKHGPDFSKVRPCPYWINKPGELLSLPLTQGFFGPLSRFGAGIDKFLDSPPALALRLRGVLSRASLLVHCTLSPEGVPVEEQIGLAGEMIARGYRIFSLTYHSPSLEPGHTPYVRTEADLNLFIRSIERFLDVFFNDLGGRPADPISLRALLLKRQSASLDTQQT